MSDGEGIIRKAGDVGPDNLLFTEEALRAQDGNVVPLTREPGGPVIGTATLKYDEEEKVLKADFHVTDPKVAEWLRNDPPNIFMQ
jgi:hypothetical protein